MMQLQELYLIPQNQQLNSLVVVILLELLKMLKILELILMHMEHQLMILLFTTLDRLQ